MRHRLFPDIDIPDALIASGWSTANVYGNDLCVRLTRPGWSLWVDHADADQRECGGPRFALVPTDADLEPTDHAVYADSLTELDALIASYLNA